MNTPSLAVLPLYQKLKDKLSGHDILSVLLHAKNYLTANIALKALGIISMPIFTRLLTREDYGLLAIYGSWGGILVVLLSLNAHASVGRYYYEETEDFGEFIGTTIIIIAIITSIMVVISAFSYKYLISWLELPGKLIPYLIISCIVGIVFTIYAQIIVPQKKSKEFAILNLSRGIGTFCVSVLLVYLLSEDRYMGKIWGSLFVSMGVMIYVVFKIRTFTVFSFRFEHVKYILTYSLPLIPYVLSSTILAQFDRIMIGKIVNTAATGVYSVGYSIGMIIVFFYSALDAASRPDYFKFMNGKEFKRWDVLIGQIFSITSIVALGLIFFSKEVITILAAKKFHEATAVVPIVVIGYLLYATASTYGRYVGYEKKTIFSSINILVAGIVNIVLNAIFIPKYGYIAAAYTTGIGYFTWFVLCWITAKFVLKQKTTPLIVVWKPIIYLLGFVGLFYIFECYLTNFILIFMIKVGLLASFAYVLLGKKLRDMMA